MDTIKPERLKVLEGSVKNMERLLYSMSNGAMPNMGIKLPIKDHAGYAVT